MEGVDRTGGTAADEARVREAAETQRTAKAAEASGPARPSTVPPPASPTTEGVPAAAVPPVRSTPSIAAPSRLQNLEPQVCSPVRSHADLRTQRTPTRQQCATRPFAEDLARSSMGSSRYRPSRVTVLTAVKLIELAREGYAVGELGKRSRLLRHAARRGLQALEIASQRSKRCDFKLENDR